MDNRSHTIGGYGAFPNHCSGVQTDGLTKRELFAAMAIHGMCAHHGTYGPGNGPGDIAVRARDVADALIAALSDKEVVK